MSYEVLRKEHFWSTTSLQQMPGPGKEFRMCNASERAQCSKTGRCKHEPEFRDQGASYAQCKEYVAELRVELQEGGE